MDQPIKENRELSIWEALIPVFLLIVMLSYNVFVYGDDSLSGSNQFILLMGAAVAAIIGFLNKTSYKQMLDAVAKNLDTTTGAILILLMVGALAGTWLLSGVIPAMIYYGLQVLSTAIFLPAAVIICSIISLVAGSSWTTSATVGIALIGIGGALGIPLGMVAGAVVSGAYFGDKLSPLSDTTNLAAAMAGTDLFTHIRYMTLTTVPTLVITLIVFSIIGANLDVQGTANIEGILTSIESSFNITPWLFIVPVLVIGLIVRKTEPLIALLLGTVLAAGFAVIFQSELLHVLSGSDNLTFKAGYKVVMDAITVSFTVPTDNETLMDLFDSGGMAGMLPTIWLIICAMVFGGVMEAIGALAKISRSLLKISNSIFSLFANTVASCLMLNITASDQYLAIVIPGKMYSQAFKDKGLAPENLSRTLEDSGTVTSVLVPWNTCGAYNAGVLGVDTLTYLPYAVFNYVSPFMTLLFAALNIKIKMLLQKNTAEA